MITARARIAHHRAGAVIDLGFFTGRRQNHGARLRRLRSAAMAGEALDAGVASSEAVIVDQILIDRFGVAPLLSDSSMKSR